MIYAATVNVEDDVFVLDASAVLRLYLLDGALPPTLEPAVTRALRGDALLLAPDLLWIACASEPLNQVRRQTLSGEEACELLREIGQPIQTMMTDGLCEPGVALATRQDVSASNALYLALPPPQEEACLIAADQKLQLAAQHCGCRL